MKNLKRSLVLALAMTALAGCAEKQLKQQVDQATAAEPAMNRRSLDEKATDTVLSSTSLTPAERTRLLELHAKTESEVARIRQDILKLDAVLFETITTAPYDAKKVDVIKSRLKSLNDKRLAAVFSAIDQAEDIIGYRAKVEDDDMTNFLLYRQMYHDLD